MAQSSPLEDLSPEELAEYREIFDLVDRDRSGSITKHELGELMDTLGINATPEEVDLMVDEIDQDNNGEIDFGDIPSWARDIAECIAKVAARSSVVPGEFVAVMSKKVNASYTSEQVKNAFKIFEGTCPPGYVRVDTVVQALTKYASEKLTENEAQELVSQLEPDFTGMVNYVEYVNMVSCGYSSR